MRRLSKEKRFAGDNMGRLIGTTTQYSFLAGHTFTNSYTYDAASNRTGFTDPANGTVAYGGACPERSRRNTLNRLTSLNSSLAGQFSFGGACPERSRRNELSRRTSLTRPNGVNTTYTYDNLSRLLSVLHQAGGVTIDGAAYTVDNAGNRTAKTNYLDNSAEQYAYDAIYQLTQVTRNGNTSEAYSYDEVGNRLSSLNLSPWTFNDSNQLLSTPATTFAYDNNGNTTSKTDTSGTTSYAWDYENRLTSVTLPGEGGVVTFKYDAFGRRIQKSGPLGLTNYVYDGANIVAEYDVSGTMLVRYAQGAGIDEPLAMSRSGALSFYDADGLSSITSLADGSGAVVQNYVTDAFGKEIGATGAVANAARYTGREWDAETGLYYYRARYYDPTQGRFLSEDPLKFATGSNFYTYVGNSPAASVDPLGLAEMTFTTSFTPMGLLEWLQGFFPNGMTGYTIPVLKLEGECVEQKCGGYRLKIRMRINFDIHYYTQGTKKHELGHRDIAVQFFNERKPIYEQYEQTTYKTKAFCEDFLHKYVIGFPQYPGMVPDLRQKILDDLGGDLKARQDAYDQTH